MKGAPVLAHVALAAAALAATLGVWSVARPDLLAVSLHANEAQAVADLLEFAEGEDLFRASGFGEAGAPAVLADPRRSLLPGQTFVHPRFLWPVRNGYRFVFHASPFAYVALPAVPGRTGQRSFLYDGAGRVVHARSDGLEPRVEDPVVASR
jgi:hypothetical protein